MRFLLSTRRTQSLFYGTAIVVFLIFLVFSLRERLPSQSRFSEDATPQPQNTPTHNDPRTVPWPQEYTRVSEHTSECAIRYETDYLSNLRKSAVSYCSPTSPSLLQCFHSRTASERVDTFCYGTRARFDVEQHKYELPCALRQLSQDEIDSGIPPVSDFVGYWYDTGPKHVFDQAVILKNASQISPPPTAPRLISVLTKREGVDNLWHGLMEIFAASMTIDVLRSSVNPESGKVFLSEFDNIDMQVVLLDDAPDGAYEGLFEMFASRPVVRLKDLSESHVTDIIVPLAGGGNTFWQGDWEVRPCEGSDLLRVFASRVLSYCKVETRPREGDIHVTWINRTGTRRLLDQERLIEAAKTKILHMTFESVDFADLSFCEQVQVARNTDVLMGVHGAGLTHSLWLQRGSATVKILPPELQYKGFRNIASMLGLDYFSTHGDLLGTTAGARGDWQGTDVAIDEEKFVLSLRSAVRSVYKKGLRDFDVL